MITNGESESRPVSASPHSTHAQSRSLARDTRAKGHEHDYGFNPFPTLSNCGLIGSGTLQLAPPRPPGTDLKVGTESRRHEEVLTGRWCHELRVIHTN